MGKVLAETFAPARRAFQEVDDALSQKLSKIMWEGPQSDLTLTENAQPAIMAASLAVIAVLKQEAGLDFAKHARLVAGHSLGEYSALAAAGSLTIADAARLLRIRGDAMQRAVPVGEGAMAAIIGLARGQAMQSAVPVGEGAMTALIGADIETAEAVAKEAAQGQICVIANDNAPGQVVLSGDKAAIDRAAEIAKAKGVKRAIPLSVSAPFHCILMQPAADVMREALAKVTIHPPAVPVLANFTAQETAEPDTIRGWLVEQVTNRVRWRESMLALRSLGVTTTVEASGNKVLTGMVKRTDKALQTITLDTPADIEAFAKVL